MNPIFVIVAYLILAMLVVKCDASSATPASLYRGVEPLVEQGGGGTCDPSSGWRRS